MGTKNYAVCPGCGHRLLQTAICRNCERQKDDKQAMAGVSQLLDDISKLLIAAGIKPRIRKNKPTKK